LRPAGNAQLVIRPEAPYAITPHLREFTAEGMPTPCIYDRRSRSCRRLVRWGVRERVAYEARVLSEGWAPAISVEVFEGDARVAEEVVRHVLNTDFRYPRIEQLTKACPGLSSILSKHPGLRPALNPSLWESLVKAIASQQIRLHLANRLIAKLTMRLGAELVIKGREFYDIPTPEEVVEAGPEALRSAGLSRRKAEYLVGIAEAVVRRGYDIESITRLRPDDAVEELRKFRGVGPWTAKLAYMAATGNLSLMLGEDLSVSRGLRLVRCEEGLGGVKEYLGLISYLASIAYEVRRSEGSGVARPAP